MAQRMQELITKKECVILPPEELVMVKLRREDFDPVLNEKETLALYGVALQAVVEAGRKLLERKANMEHGQFTDWLENVWPDSPRTARRWMRIALCLELNPHMKTYIPALSRAGKSKIYEFFELPEEEQLAICEGRGNGELKNLDDVAAMSVRNLQEIARKGRAQLEKRDKENRLMKEENEKQKEDNLALKVGPKTDREFLKALEDRQSAVVVAFAQLEVLTDRAQTLFQKRAALAAWEYVIKQNTMMEIDNVMAISRDTNYFEDSGGWNETALLKPDGIDFMDVMYLEAWEKRTERKNAETWGAPNPDLLKKRMHEEIENMDFSASYKEHGMIIDGEEFPLKKASEA